MNLDRFVYTTPKIILRVKYGRDSTTDTNNFSTSRRLQYKVMRSMSTLRTKNILVSTHTTSINQV